MTSARCRAVVFDLDGTLVDSLADINSALDGAMTDAGLATPDREDVRLWIGDGAYALVERAVVSAGAPDQTERVHARFRERYRETPIGTTRLYDGIAEVLDRLTAAGAVLGVLSNKPHDLTVRIADVLLATWPFAAVAGARPGIPLKPDPDAAEAIAMELGVEPRQCAMVGDSPIDVALARAAHMRAVAVTWGFRPRGELVAAEPDFLVDQPADLFAALR